jgi:hypothetical protein
VNRHLTNRPILLDLRPGLRTVRALVSFESLFILFLVCGTYKTDPRFSSIPVDLTVLFFAVGIAMGAVIIYREGIYLPGLTPGFPPDRLRRLGDDHRSVDAKQGLRP